RSRRGAGRARRRRGSPSARGASDPGRGADRRPAGAAAGLHGLLRAEDGGAGDALSGLPLRLLHLRGAAVRRPHAGHRAPRVIRLARAADGKAEAHHGALSAADSGQRRDAGRHEPGNRRRRLHPVEGQSRSEGSGGAVPALPQLPASAVRTRPEGAAALGGAAAGDEAGRCAGRVIDSPPMAIAGGMRAEEIYGRAKLASGLILFLFLLTHLSNHALGLVSLQAMETGAVLFKLLWRSWPGTVVLYTAALLHPLLALFAWLRRGHYRGIPWQGWTQLGLGLCIPLLVVEHVLGTRIADEVFGLNDSYAYVLIVMFVQSPRTGLLQNLLILIA